MSLEGLRVRKRDFKRFSYYDLPRGKGGDASKGVYRTD